MKGFLVGILMVSAVSAGATYDRIVLGELITSVF